MVAIYLVFKVFADIHLYGFSSLAPKSYQV